MDLSWLPAHALRNAYLKHELSPLEVTRYFLDRIDRLDPKLHCFLTVDHEGALAQARRAELAMFEGEALGLLHGVPVSVKDTIDTRGLRTTYGSAVYADHIPRQDAVAVGRLRAAGAVIIGKSNTPEFALCGRTVNHLGPECLNPWDVRRTPGGSSGGAGSGIAAGLTPVGIGTDSGGSVRYPAAFCGLVGLLPSAGRVPALGNREATEFGMAFSSIGPMARDVRDVATLAQVMSGFDPRDPMSSQSPVPDFVGALEGGIKGIRCAWIGAPPDALRVPGCEETIRAATQSLGDLGARVEEIAIDHPDTSAIVGPLRVVEAGKMRSLARNSDTAKLLTPYILGLASLPLPSAEEERSSLSARGHAITLLKSIFARFDLIASPTTCFPAPECPDDPWRMFVEYDRYLRQPTLANIAGLAAASIPCGMRDGLPLGLHLMAPRGSEALLLRACRAFEAAHPWSDAHPPVADML